MGKRWTKRETEIIKSKFPIKGSKVAEDLPDRTLGAIYNRAHMLGLKSKVRYIRSPQSNAWTDKEDEILRKGFGKKGKKICEDLPNRTLKAICCRANKLGLKYNYGAKDWTEEEDQILKDFYPIVGSNVILKLPNRTRSSVYSKAKELGLRYYSLPKR